MRWMIELDGDGPDLILSQGRRLKLRRASEDDVRQYLREHATPQDQVYRVDKDGYASRVRVPGRRRGWRK